jgi:hypothetical protein
MSATIPFRIDAELVNQARTAGEIHDRTPTAQIEHWAKLGRVLESVLSGKSVERVKELGRVDDLERILAMTQTTAGQARALAVIARHKGPVYSSDPEHPELVVEEAPDGTKRLGKFVHREFVPVRPKAKRARVRQKARR